MKNVLAAAAAAAVLVIGLNAIAHADPFDPQTGTVTVMANGGTVYLDQNIGPQPVDGSATVASLTFPAGRYQLFAKAWVDFASGSASFAQCGFINGIAVNDSTRASGSASSATMVAAGIAELAVETDVEYACASDDPVDVHRVNLVATTVSAIVDQS